MLKGETSHQAVLRVAQGTIGLPAANVLKIKSTATPLRVDGAPVVTMLYFVRRRSMRAAPRGPLYAGVADLFYSNVRSILMVFMAGFKG